MSKLCKKNPEHWIDSEKRGVGELTSVGRSGKAEAMRSSRGTSKLLYSDAARLLDVISPRSVDLIITSPPYFDMKQYDSKIAIGNSETYEGYLAKLGHILEMCFRATKSTGSMYVVADVFKKNGEMKLLPLDLARISEKIGWRLRDVVIWDKTRTLPWSRKGELRNGFEFVLFFTKSNRYKFRIDRLRHPPENLKSWWVKYPERYNPRGAVPRSIWVVPIPTQGSWGNGNLKHSCPFPPDLVSMMIDLSSDSGDVVLDPFAGSGSVLAVAEARGRLAIGFEVNRKYIENYRVRLRHEIIAKMHRNKPPVSSFRFEETVWKLRQLKYAAILGNQVQRQFRRKAVMYAWLAGKTPGSGSSRLRPHLHLQMAKVEDCPRAIEIAAGIVGRAPLSKFGIDARITVGAKPPSRTSSFSWLYPSGIFYRAPLSAKSLSGTPETSRGLKIHVRSNLYVDPGQPSELGP